MEEFEIMLDLELAFIELSLQKSVHDRERGSTH
jgi:hypothetical protein